ncbi:unnamed protein product [Phytophthora lilii]|uniref:Unnamed protein product n=1 Tax=Phytophthora lilii TaxID=2077276 RepID=A0A9W6TWH9_9STRA|nr:unnamed protein product [Phytophthora lilii]
MQRSLSIDGRAKPLPRSLRGLSHGLQMDLQQAVRLEKQELKKMGLLPPPAQPEALPKAAAAPDAEDDDAPPYWLYRQQRLVRRAASFTSGAPVPCMPCSPPVPIPQHHEAQRRYSAAGGLGEHMTHGVDAEQLQHMSQAQCEARLWDEFWNYKLSFESRESFEAASSHMKDGAVPLKYRSESSMGSTADTVVEDDEDVRSVGPEEDEHVHRYGDVFEMDDL